MSPAAARNKPLGAEISMVYSRSLRESRAGKWFVAGMSAMCLVVGSAHAATVSGGGVTYYPGQAYGDFNVSSSGDSPVSYGAPLTASSVGAWASSNAGDANFYGSVTPATQTWRSVTAASSHGGTENTAWSSAAYRSFQPLTVAAGTSGLNIGDPVVLQFTLRLDGTMAMGTTNTGAGAIALPATYGYAASASELMHYQVFNPRVDNETALLQFHHEAYATYGYSKDEYSDVLTDTFSSNGRYTTDARWTWTDLASNVEIDDTQSPVPLVVGPVTRAPRLVDTGYVTLSMDARIGDLLWIDGELTTRAAGWGDLRMYALSDFSSTFDTEITSTTAGVELLGLQAGVAAVPEPETYALMLLGLGCVGWTARRRQARNA